MWCSYRYDCVLASGIETVSFLAPDADNVDHFWVVSDADQCPWHEKFLSGDNDLMIAHDPFPLAAVDIAGTSSKRQRYDHEADDSDCSDEDMYTSDEESTGLEALI